MPAPISKFFFGATLIALRKKDGGVRPIAVGCVMRRMISTAASHEVRERAAKLLSPRQIGIGIADGATAAAHAARRFLSSCDANNGLLKLDFKNAFNAVDRAQVLKEVNTHFPELAPYVYAAYGSSSYLFFGEHKLDLAHGVQQGDPLGPLLFSLAIHPSTYTVNCSFAVWYLDDGTIGGFAQEVIDSFKCVESGCSKIGLELNISKCEVISGDASFCNQVSAQLPGCRIVAPNNAELLGAPLGQAAADESLSKKAAGLHEIRARLKTIERHDALAVLRVSLGHPKAIYSLRSGPAFRIRKVTQI